MWGNDGVLVAQGGSALGYSLFVKDGVLHFATRHQGKLSIVSSKAKLSDAEKVLVKFRASGEVTLSVDGEELAKGEVPGAIPMPIDGLEVGRDEGGVVGEYSAPFAFEGTIDSVVAELGNAKKKKKQR